MRKKRIQNLLLKHQQQLQERQELRAAGNPKVHIVLNNGPPSGLLDKLEQSTKLGRPRDISTSERVWGDGKGECPSTH